MGKVIEEVKLTSLFDSTKTKGVEAVVDTGATMLILPQDIVGELGLRRIGERRMRYADNHIQIKPIYRGVILELKGRDGIFDVKDISQADRRKRYKESLLQPALPCGSLGVCVGGIAESRTCSGSSRVTPNKLGSPTPRPHEIPKSLPCQ